MNKLAKGAIAGAAGIALLLGGAGTFAYWNDQAQVSGGTIVAGNLQVVNDGTAGVWKDQTGSAINIATYKIVPGDTLTYTDDLTVTAVGNHLTATLGLGAQSIAGSTSATADTRLASYLTKNAVLAASGTGVTGTGPYTITAGATGVTSVVTVTATIAFPRGAEGEYNDAKLGSVNLSNMNVTLAQTFPAQP
ncbi:alternate-type signal peptide domain-containing protein [Herbiconiux solani]|uniref:alternate-type signal peptide domain-containing protein n=1 Tax=Herbiconiux solani TaxID=661329 RepID=UPI00082433E1|nr:alternate-type signal peptide domain-containing protein [Herbiconiux solani]